MRQMANNEKKMFGFSQHYGNTFSKTMRPHPRLANGCLLPPESPQKEAVGVCWVCGRQYPIKTVFWESVGWRNEKP